MPLTCSGGSGTGCTGHGFNTHKVRTLTDTKGNPWFVAADVCRVLELKPHMGSFTNNLRVLDDKDITYTKNLGVKLSGKGQSNLSLISESGLYKLIMRSNKPQAKACINALQGII